MLRAGMFALKGCFKRLASRKGYAILLSFVARAVRAGVAPAKQSQIGWLCSKAEQREKL
jgi:hypothetical protein